MVFDEGKKKLIARSWIRYQSDPNTAIILRERLSEPDYQKTLSVDGDIWPYDDEPEGVITELTFYAPDIAYDITLRIIDLINIGEDIDLIDDDNELLVALVAAGPLESLIKFHEDHKKYRSLYEKLAAKSPKHKHVLSRVWL